MKQYIEIKDLEIYKLSVQLSDLAWIVYSKLDWHNKKIMGDQFIEAADSAGANIIEGYFRFHYLDKIKFYYVSRASLAEACVHWLNLLNRRKLVAEDMNESIIKIHDESLYKLNIYIKTIYNCKDNNKNQKIS